MRAPAEAGLEVGGVGAEIATLQRRRAAAAGVGAPALAVVVVVVVAVAERVPPPPTPQQARHPAFGVAWMRH